MNEKTVEEIVKEMPTNQCHYCSGDGYTVEHDPSDPTGETPMQVQCDYCHAEGVITTLDEVRELLTQERTKQAELVGETEKAFGGCKKCYGKGYSTVLDSTTYHADFIGDKTYSKPNNPMRFCSCDRGIQLQALTQPNNPN